MSAAAMQLLKLTCMKTKRTKLEMNTHVKRYSNPLRIEIQRIILYGSESCEGKIGLNTGRNAKERGRSKWTHIHMKNITWYLF